MSHVSPAWFDFTSEKPIQYPLAQNEIASAAARNSQTAKPKFPAKATFG
jgi:hypothetical protein